MSEISNKRIKGSAIVDEEGGFIFTPYNTLPENEKRIKLIKAIVNGAIYKTKTGYSLRLRLNSSHLPALHKLVADVMDLYDAAKKDNNK